MARMSLKGDECVKHSDIMEASEILARIRQLGSVDDPLRLMRGGPMVQTREELAEFVEVYNELVNGYTLLKMDFLSLNADQKSMFQLAVDRMNVAAGAEPILDENKRPLFNYTFQLAAFVSTDAGVKRTALAVAANSAFYIVLAGVNRREKARHMARRQEMAVGDVD